MPFVHLGMSIMDQYMGSWLIISCTLLLQVRRSRLWHRNGLHVAVLNLFFYLFFATLVSIHQFTIINLSKLIESSVVRRTITNHNCLCGIALFTQFNL